MCFVLLPAVPENSQSLLGRQSRQVRAAGSRPADAGSGVSRAVVPVGGTVGGERDNAALLVEGSLCAEYFTVRDMLYGQYHVC